MYRFLINHPMCSTHFVAFRRTRVTAVLLLKTLNLHENEPNTFNIRSNTNANGGLYCYSHYFGYSKVAFRALHLTNSTNFHATLKHTLLTKI